MYHQEKVLFFPQYFQIATSSFSLTLSLAFFIFFFFLILSLPLTILAMVESFIPLKLANAIQIQVLPCLLCSHNCCFRQPSSKLFSAWHSFISRGWFRVFNQCDTHFLEAPGHRKSLSLSFVNDEEYGYKDWTCCHHCVVLGSHPEEVHTWNNNKEKWKDIELESWINHA